MGTVSTGGETTCAKVVENAAGRTAAQREMISTKYDINRRKGGTLTARSRVDEASVKHLVVEDLEQFVLVGGFSTWCHLWI